MSANASNSSLNFANWQYNPISDLVLLPFTLLSNGLVALAFLIDSQLRTPFNIYIANIVFTNFIYTLIADPLYIIMGLYSSFWMGAAVCDLAQYISNVFIGVLVNTHMLITLNRIWALTFPHSYAQRHTFKTAVYCCLIVWVSVHAVFLPGLFINASHRLPLETSGCILNYRVLLEWNMFVECGMYVLPQTVITAAYPYLLCKRRKVRHSRQVIELSSNTAQRKHRARNRAFRVLTTSTVSVTVTWTPGTVYYGMSAFMYRSNFPPVFLFLLAFLFLMQTFLDPILFMLVLPELRTAVWQIVKRCGCRLFRKGSVAAVS